MAVVPPRAVSIVTLVPSFLAEMMVILHCAQARVAVTPSREAARGEGVNVGGMGVAVNVAVGGFGVADGARGVALQPASMAEIMVTIPAIGKSFLLSSFILLAQLVFLYGWVQTEANFELTPIRWWADMDGSPTGDPGCLALHVLSRVD